MLYYDITDLIRHAGHSHKVTGIQRVVLEGLRGLAQDITPIFVSPVTGRWYSISNVDFTDMNDLSGFRGLVEYADLLPGVPVSHYHAYSGHYMHVSSNKKAAQRTLSRIDLPILTRRARRHVRTTVWGDVVNLHKDSVIAAMGPPQPGDIIAAFGTPWNALPQYRELFSNAPEGVRKVILVYDLIPLNSPFVPDHLRDAFREFIPFVLESATDIIVNSDSAAKDLRDFAKSNQLFCPPIAKVQLAHKLPDIVSQSGDSTLRVRKLFPETYALCVGSIESRKNHLNLLIMWAKFVRSEAYAGEKLVIAGAWLWDFGSLQNLLHETGHIYGSVIIVEHPSDDELRDLYRHCRVSLFPSHYEGWGLPIGEALSFGKPCLHFDNSSLVEAGCGMTDFVPYQNLQEFYKGMVMLMQDDAYYESRVALIKKGKSKLRGWDDVSKDVAKFFRLMSKKRG